MTRRHLPTLLVLAAILVALALPAISAGAAPAPSPARAQGGIEVRVPNFVFDPVLGDEPKLSNAERFDGQETGFRLVQFYGATEDAWLAGLESAGLTVLQYYPHYTYLVWGDTSSLNAAEGLDFVRWAGNFHPAYKMNSDLAGRAAWSRTSMSSSTTMAVSTAPSPRWRPWAQRSTRSTRPSPTKRSTLPTQR